MGIAGSIVDQDFFQKYLGMRTECIDMTEFLRRINEGIYDKDEFDRAMKWTKANCKEGPDNNRPEVQRSREEKDLDWEMSVMMTMIARDMMSGNPRLAEMGYEEEAAGRNALLSGFQGQRQWTDFKCNGDFMETMLNTSFDWNGVREPYLCATENDAMNGVVMMFGHLLTNTAQIFSDVRTYWSPEAIERVTGWKPDGIAAGGLIHLINSGSTCLDGTGQQTGADGKPVMKPFWEISEEEVTACLEATEFRPASTEYFRGGGWSTDFLTKGGMPCTMSRNEPRRRPRPRASDCEGYSAEIPDQVHDKLDKRTDPTWPTTWFAPIVDGKDGPFKDAYSVMAAWGANHGAVSYGHIGADLITLASILRIPVCMHNVPADKIFRPSTWNAFGYGQGGRRLQGMRRARTGLQVELQ